MTSNYKEISKISIINNFLEGSETYLTYRGLYYLCQIENLSSLEFSNISFGFESINCLSFKSLKELSLINCNIDFEDLVFNQGDEIELFESLEVLVSPNTEIVKYFKNLKKLTVYTSERIVPDLIDLKKLEDFTIIGFQGKSVLNFRFLVCLKERLKILTFKNCNISLMMANYISSTFFLNELNFIESCKFFGEKDYHGIQSFNKPNELFDLIEQKSTIEILRIHTIQFLNESTLKNIAIGFPKLKFISLINQNIGDYSNLNFCENVLIKDINSNNVFLTSIEESDGRETNKLKLDFIFCKHCKSLVNKHQYREHNKSHWNEAIYFYCPNSGCKYEGNSYSHVSKHLKSCNFYHVICHGCKEEFQYSDFELHICQGINQCFEIKKVTLKKFYEEKNGKMIKGICKLLDVENDSILRWRRKYE